MLEEAFGSDRFTTAQARSVRVSQRRLSLAVASGDLMRERRGVYRLAGPEPDTRQAHLDMLDDLLARHPEAALAGASAAANWDLPCPDPWGDWRTLPPTLCAPRRIRSVRWLDERHRTVAAVADRRTTDLVTTAVDVSRQLPAAQALIVLDAIARRLAKTSDRRLLTSRTVRERVRTALLAPLAQQPQRPHRRRIARTMAWADPAADSPPESYLRGHILLADLPPPSVNHPITGASGRQYWVDLYWPETGRAIEIDGKVKYGEQDALYREKVRHDDLRAAGVDPLRWTAQEVFAHAPLLVQDLR